MQLHELWAVDENGVPLMVCRTSLFKRMIGELVPLWVREDLETCTVSRKDSNVRWLRVECSEWRSIWEFLITDYRLIVAFQLYWGHLTRMGSQERQRRWMDPPFNPPPPPPVCPFVFLNLFSPIEQAVSFLMLSRSHCPLGHNTVFDEAPPANVVDVRKQRVTSSQRCLLMAEIQSCWKMVVA